MKIPNNLLNDSSDFKSRFVGREDIVFNLMNSLRSDKSDIYELFGMAGIGKTTVARYVAEQAREENLFPGGIIWISCRSTAI